MTDDEMEQDNAPPPPPGPYLLPQPKPTMNGMILDRMEDIRVEQVNFDQTLESNTAVLMALRTELATFYANEQWRNRVYLALAIASLALMILVLMATMYAFGAVR